jgi:hypothetical protein
MRVEAWTKQTAIVPAPTVRSLPDHELGSKTFMRLNPFKPFERLRTIEMILILPDLFDRFSWILQRNHACPHQPSLLL